MRLDAATADDADAMHRRGWKRDTEFESAAAGPIRLTGATSFSAIRGVYTRSETTGAATEGTVIEGLSIGWGRIGGMLVLMQGSTGREVARVW